MLHAVHTKDENQEDILWQTNVKRNVAEKKTMTLRGAVFLGIGSMVGAGIFALFGEAGTIAGAAVWVSFLIGGIIALLQGYSFAKLGARYPSAGGMIAWLVRGFGKGLFTGGVVMLGYFSVLIVTAMVAVTFGNYATESFPGRECQPNLGENLCCCHRYLADLCQFDRGRSSHQSADGHRIHCPGGLERLCHRHAFEYEYLDAGSIFISSVDLYPGQRGPDLLRLPGFWGDLFFRWRHRKPKESICRGQCISPSVLPCCCTWLLAIGVFGTLTVDEVIANADTALAVAAYADLRRVRLYHDLDLLPCFPPPARSTRSFMLRSVPPTPWRKIGHLPPVFGHEAPASRRRHARDW